MTAEPEYAKDACDAPYLKITGPMGEQFCATAPEGQVRSIGRSPENDIVLGPDQQVSRVHCTVVSRNGILEVTDKGSLNGTLVRREGEWRWVRNETVSLQPGELIRITGRARVGVDGASSPGFWDLTYYDPQATQPVAWTSWAPRLEFAWGRSKIYRLDAGQLDEIAIKPGSQEFKLLRYMAEKNVTNGNAAVDCTHEELISAVWEGDQAHGHTPNDIAHLVRDLRTRLEPRPEAPRFIITVRGGYRLVSTPLPELDD